MSAVAAHDAKSRRRLPPGIRRAMILDEALALFAERHFSTVTVRDIAAACDMNVGLIYHYFENKEQLCRDVLAHAIGQLQARYEQTQPAEGDPAAQLIGFITLHTPVAPMVKQMVKIMSDFSAGAMRDPLSDQLIRDFYAREQALLELYLRRGIETGIFKPVDVPLAARSISLHLDGIFYAAAARGDDRIAADIMDLCKIVEQIRR